MQHSTPELCNLSRLNVIVVKSIWIWVTTSDTWTWHCIGTTILQRAKSINPSLTKNAVAITLERPCKVEAIDCSWRAALHRFSFFADRQWYHISPMLYKNGSSVLLESLLMTTRLNLTSVLLRWDRRYRFSCWVTCHSSWVEPSVTSKVCRLSKPSDNSSFVSRRRICASSTSVLYLKYATFSHFRKCCARWATYELF